MRHASLVVLVVASLGRIARADEPDPPKSHKVALTLSIAGTLIPYAMMRGGIELPGTAGDVLAGSGLALSLVGPSLGHWYAGRDFTIGLPVRLVGAGLLLVMVDDLSGDIDQWGEAWLAGFAGVTALSAGAIIDIATSRGAVDTYNHEHHLAIAPIVVRTPGTQAFGIGLAGAF